MGEEAILTDVEGDTRAKASVYATSVKQSDTFTTEYLFDDQTDDVKPKRVKKAANSRPGSAINPADSSIEVLVFSVDDVRDRLKVITGMGYFEQKLILYPHPQLI